MIAKKKILCIIPFSLPRMKRGDEWAGGHLQEKTKRVPE